MILTTILRKKYVKTWSDLGVYISPTDAPGVLYMDAIDPIHSDREYVETEVPIPKDDEIEDM